MSLNKWRSGGSDLGPDLLNVLGGKERSHKGEGRRPIKVQEGGWGQREGKGDPDFTPRPARPLPEVLLPYTLVFLSQLQCWPQGPGHRGFRTSNPSSLGWTPSLPFPPGTHFTCQYPACFPARPLVQHLSPALRPPELNTRLLRCGPLSSTPVSCTVVP